MNLTTTERYQAFVEAGLQAAINVCMDNFVASGPEIAMRINSIDPAEIVRNVMAVMNSGRMRL